MTVFEKDESIRRLLKREPLAHRHAQGSGFKELFQGFAPLRARGRKIGPHMLRGEVAAEGGDGEKLQLTLQLEQDVFAAPPQQRPGAAVYLLQLCVRR